MFFLLSHILVGKYYPNFLTQLIIGCSFYVISFFIVKGVLSKTSIEQLKYLALSAVAIDATFIIFRKRKKISNTPTESYSDFESDPNAHNLYEPTIFSEINDFRVMHDFSDTNIPTDNSMFSTSDEKPVDGTAEEKEDKEDKI